MKSPHGRLLSLPWTVSKQSGSLTWSIQLRDILALPWTVSERSESRLWSIQPLDEIFAHRKIKDASAAREPRRSNVDRKSTLLIAELWNTREWFSCWTRFEQLFDSRIPLSLVLKGMASMIIDLEYPFGLFAGTNSLDEHLPPAATGGTPFWCIDASQHLFRLEVWPSNEFFEAIRFMYSLVTSMLITINLVLRSSNIGCRYRLSSSEHLEMETRRRAQWRLDAVHGGNAQFSNNCGSVFDSIGTSSRTCRSLGRMKACPAVSRRSIWSRNFTPRL